MCPLAKKISKNSGERFNGIISHQLKFLYSFQFPGSGPNEKRRPDCILEMPYNAQHSGNLKQLNNHPNNAEVLMTLKALCRKSELSKNPVPKVMLDRIVVDLFL